ncbi:MAG: polymer-forming cytoskeletal protein [Pseudomonadota bacterium]
MFTKTKDGTTPSSPSNPTQDAIRPASSKPAGRAAASIICSDMKINGSVTSEGALQVDGAVEGDVSAQDIVIGASGVITGEVKAEVITVKGTIRGSIRGRKVELETGAKVEGDILHTSLSIQPNAVFEGQVKHATDPLQNSGPKPAAPSAPNMTPNPGNPNSVSAPSTSGTA